MRQKQIETRGISLHYGERGQGPCLLLIHGYLEDSRIWQDFLEHLPQTIRVITPDLPGHGKSGVYGKEHGMDELAGALRNLLDAEQVEKAFVVGHSMGGYVAMAFAELFPSRVEGTVLFHSTCFADSPEKRENREREQNLVRCGKKQQIVSLNIPKAFATDHLDEHEGHVEKAKNIALSSPDPGVIALLEGMKNRPDRSHVLSDPAHSFLLISGMKDNYIAPEVSQRLSEMAPHASTCMLEESGHMGFLEEPEAAAAALLGFIKEKQAKG